MLLIILSLVGLYLFHNYYWKRRNYPPGPAPLPILGNMAELKKFEPGYGAYDLWHKQYGPIFTVWLGTTPFVIIADYPNLKKTFVLDGEAYMEKFHFSEATKEYRGGEYGVVETDGDQWREHRRFAIHLLRDLGLNKDGMEQRVLTEVDYASLALKSQVGRDGTNMATILDAAVGSVINQLLFGYRFDETTISEFYSLKKMISSQMRMSLLPSTTLLFLNIWLKNFPYFKDIWKEIMGYRDFFYAFFTRQIEEHEKEIDYQKEGANDYVEAFLKEKKKREQAGDMETYCHLQLTNMCLDLWIAGLETTSNTLSWGVIYLINYPETQAKLHAELDNIIGSDRIITMTDKNKLVYTAAVINEIQRMANLLPMNLPHKTARDVQLDKWWLPKGTPVIAQVSICMYDENIFPDPLTFNPDRFIDEKGSLKKYDELMPFSIGKRQCLGEGLARMELFLFIANIFNRFKLSAVDPLNPPSMKKTAGMTMQPLDYKCIVTSRY